MKKVHVPTEQDLIAFDILQSNEEDSFQYIWTNFRDHIYKYARYKNSYLSQEQIEDIFYEALLTIIKYRTTYDPSQGGIYTWLAMRTRYAAQSYVQSHITHYKQTTPLTDEVANTSAGPALIMSSHHNEPLSPKMSFALEVLGAKDQRAEMLMRSHYIQEISQEELAGILQSNVDTVRVWLCRARKRLRSILERM